MYVHSDRWAVLLLWIIVLAVFGRSLGFDFNWWDDHYNIGKNPLLNPPSIQSLIEFWTKPHFQLYVPVTFTVWAGLSLVARMGEADPFGISLNPTVFRAGNLLIHLIAVTLVYRLLRRFASARGAWLGAAVFAVHPVQVETVCWISGTKDLLAAMFCLLGIALYVQGRDQSRKPMVGAAFVCMILAMLSKPQAMVMPAMLVVVDWLLHSGSLRRSIQRLWWWFIPVIPCLIITKLSQPGVSVYVPTLWQRFLIAGDAIGFYAAKVIWPAQLTIDYGREPSRVLAGGIGWTLLVAAVVVVGAILLARRSSLAAAAILLAVIPVAPVLGFVPFAFQVFSTVSDHYLYLSMFGIALGLSAGMSRLPLAAFRVFVMLLVGLLSLRGYFQTRSWQDDLSLFRHTTQVNPNSYAGWNNLGDSLNRRGDLWGAAQCFEQSIRVNPEWMSAYRNRSEILRVFARDPKTSPSQAREYALEAARLRVEAANRTEQAVPNEPQVVQDRLFAAEMFLLGGDMVQARHLLGKIPPKLGDSMQFRDLWMKATAQPSTAP